MTKYSIVHNNLYSFSETVTHCQLEARLTPLNTDYQKVEFSQFVLRPLAKSKRIEHDEFGNIVSFIEISRRLQSFSLSAIHTVTTLPRELINLRKSSAWEVVAENTIKPSSLIKAFLNQNKNSSYVIFDQSLFDYAKVSFTVGRPLFEATFDLMQRIHTDFLYDCHATQVNTTAIESFKLKRGVCQDLSHIAIACLRSLNLPVRYVSGYVDTNKGSGNPYKYAGDVSHAWFSVYDPKYGWLDFDPTNNTLPNDCFITLAFGRDYNDVAPLKGQTNNKAKNTLKVNVGMAVVN